MPSHASLQSSTAQLSAARSAGVVQLRPSSQSADLTEALDAIDLLAEVLTQSIGRRGPTRLQRAALAVAEGVKAKHQGAVAEVLRHRHVG